jgi:hypothetical protein
MAWRPRETAVESPLVAMAEKEGFWVRKCVWLGRRSAPDRVFARPGRGPLWIELKRPGERESGLEYGQRLEIRRMREAGLEVHVCDDVDEALAILRHPGPYPMRRV